jgi:hypothetical protein
MISFMRSALVLIFASACCVTLQAREVEPLKLIVQTRDDSSSHWFTLQPSRPYQTQNATGTYSVPTHKPLIARDE